MAEIFSPKTEEKILDFWKREQIFEKSLKLRQPTSAPASAKASAGKKATAGKKKFVFFEGPPSANGKPGLHHVLSRVYKDVICRYKTMAGFFVPRKAGWDTHGLPIELQVEKELGLKNKKDIEKYGVGKFNAKAEEIVWKYKEEWDKLTERIGFWLDLKNPYITYEPYYIETLWHIIAKIAKKKFLYQDFKVVPYCPRCGTALSSHEVALGYERIVENSVYLKFKLSVRGRSALGGKLKNNNLNSFDNVYILSWTTTPWTLPGNVALAVGEKIIYEILELKSGEFFVFAKDLKESINIESEKLNSKFTLGKNLVGLEYKPLFDAPQLKSKNSYKIYSADFVNTEEGTGVVHIAPMYGIDDFNLGQKMGLPKIHTVNLDGKFVEDFGAGIKGLAVKSQQAEELIISYLKNSGALLKIEKYAHDYPFCWRCESSLLYYAKSSWFIRMEKLKSKLIANNRKIHWVPEYIKNGRFGEWLREIKDWAISRERYWGTPLPIWQCQKCENQRVIGSLQELDRFSFKKLKKGEHNWPYNNEGNLDLHRPYVDELKLKCQKCGGPMKRVKDVIDVWFDSGAMPFAQFHWPFNKKLEYPADFISEAVDQTRGWFYTLHAIGALMDKGPAYKNIICLGHVLDEKGEKMSKSKGNVVDPWDVINKYGTDALRWYFFTINPPGEPKRFTIRDVEDKLRRFILTLSNVLVFYKTYAAEATSDKRQATSLLDKWILSRLNQTIKIVRINMDKYEITQATRPIDDFVDDLSHWWLRRSRDRFSGKELKIVSAVLKHIIEELAKLVAPPTPFLAEYLWHNAGNRESVHLRDYPKPQAKYINLKLEEQMSAIREIAAKGLALRAEAGIKVRQPLAKFQIPRLRQSFGGQAKSKITDELLCLVKDEVNVKEIVFGKEFKLDTKITGELKTEGLLREFTRQIQKLRKDAKLTPKDLISVYVKVDDKNLKNAIEHSQKILIKSINAKNIVFTSVIKDGLLIDRHFKMSPYGRSPEERENQDIWIGIIKI